MGPGWFFNMNMRLYEGWKEILKIQKFRRIVSYTGFYAFTALISYAYTNNTTRAGYSRADQFYASYPAGTELLTDTTKLYKAALGNCFEVEEWGPIEWLIMAKHFERQGKSPYAYHSVFLEARLEERSQEQGQVSHYIFTDSDIAVIGDLSQFFYDYPNFHMALTFRNIKEQPLNSGFVAVRGTVEGMRRAKAFLEEVLKVYTSRYMKASRMLGIN